MNKATTTTQFLLTFGAESTPVSPREAPTDGVVAYHALIGDVDLAAENSDELPPLSEKPLVGSATLHDPWDISNMTPLTVMQKP